MAQWWHRELAAVCDPISLDPLRTLKYPPFELRADPGRSCRDASLPNGTPDADFYDGKLLASYLVSTGNFTHPISRRDLGRPECVQLDQYMVAHRLGKPQVAAAFEHKEEYKKNPQETPDPLSPAGRVAGLRAEADAVLQALFAGASSRRTANAHRGASQPGYSVEGNMTMVDDDETAGHGATREAHVFGAAAAEAEAAARAAAEAIEAARLADEADEADAAAHAAAARAERAEQALLDRARAEGAHPQRVAEAFPTLPGAPASSAGPSWGAGGGGGGLAVRAPQPRVVVAQPASNAGAQSAPRSSAAAGWAGAVSKPPQHSLGVGGASSGWGAGPSARPASGATHSVNRTPSSSAPAEPPAAARSKGQKKAAAKQRKAAAAAAAAAAGGATAAAAASGSDSEGDASDAPPAAAAPAPAAPATGSAPVTASTCGPDPTSAAEGRSRHAALLAQLRARLADNGMCGRDADDVLAQFKQASAAYVRTAGGGAAEAAAAAQAASLYLEHFLGLFGAEGSFPLLLELAAILPSDAHRDCFGAALCRKWGLPGLPVLPAASQPAAAPAAAAPAGRASRSAPDPTHLRDPLSRAAAAGAPSSELAWREAPCAAPRQWAAAASAKAGQARPAPRAGTVDRALLKAAATRKPAPAQPPAPRVTLAYAAAQQAAARAKLATASPAPPSPAAPPPAERPALGGAAASAAARAAAQFAEEEWSQGTAAVRAAMQHGKRR